MATPLTKPLRDFPAEKVSSFLGWFSLGLGSLEIVAPKWTSRMVGMGSDRPSTVRLCGVREMLTGLRILQHPSAPDGLWARVAGDAMDLSLLGKGFFDNGARRTRLTASTAAVAGVTAMDLLCALSLSNGDSAKQAHENSFRESIAINKSPAELYRFWRSLENLPLMMSYLESVDVLDQTRSHWRAKPIEALTLDWDSEITSDQPEKLISWRSLPGSDVSTRGSVRFEPLPAGRGTAVTLEMSFDVTGLKAPIVKPFMNILTDAALRRDLRRFKQVMETGEIATTRGQPAGRSKSETWLDTIAHA